MQTNKNEELSRWTVLDFDELFMEAAGTERKLPRPIRKQKMASWPDYAQSWQAYGWESAGPIRIPPTAVEIDRLDLAIDLGLKMPEYDRRIVWAAAHSAVNAARGPKWTKIGKMLSISRHSAKADYNAALVRLTWIIDPMRAEASWERLQPRKYS